MKRFKAINYNPPHRSQEDFTWYRAWRDGWLEALKWVCQLDAERTTDEATEDTHAAIYNQIDNEIKELYK